MVAEETAAGLEIRWCDDALGLRVAVDEQGVARLAYLAPTPRDKARAGPGKEVPSSGEPGAIGLPLLDVVVAGSGRSWSGRRYCESVVGNRMRYAGHTEREGAQWFELEVSLEDTFTGLGASVSYQVLLGGGALRSRVRMTNGGTSPLTLESVTSFLGGDLAGPGGSLDDAELLWAENDWLAEARWQARSLRDALPDLNRAVHGARSRGRFALTSEGGWSSGTYLPMGAVVNRKNGHTLMWQIEHNGGWHWQVGEHTGVGPGSTYLALLGPTDVEHQWRLTLQPGESFDTVPVALAAQPRGFRGRCRQPHELPKGGPPPPPRPPRSPGHFQRLHEHVDGRPVHGKFAPARQRCRKSGGRVLLHRLWLVRRARRELVGHRGRLGALEKQVPQWHRRGARPHPGRRHGARTLDRA